MDKLHNWFPSTLSRALAVLTPLVFTWLSGYYSLGLFEYSSSRWDWWRRSSRDGMDGLFGAVVETAIVIGAIYIAVYAVRWIMDPQATTRVIRSKLQSLWALKWFRTVTIFAVFLGMISLVGVLSHKMDKAKRVEAIRQQNIAASVARSVAARKTRCQGIIAGHVRPEHTDNELCKNVGVKLPDNAALLYEKALCKRMLDAPNLRKHPEWAYDKSWYKECSKLLGQQKEAGR